MNNNYNKNTFIKLNGIELSNGKNDVTEYKECILDLLFYIDSVSVLKAVCAILQRHIQRGANY